MGLFSGKPENKTTPTPASAGPSRERPVLSSKPATDAPTTVIGKDTVIKGEIASESDMLVEGRVEGKIQGARQVVIGKNGNVNAEVEGSVVTVRGEVHGDCNASRKVEITSTGKVFGNIAAQAIVVAEGATFRGASKMLKPESRPQPVSSKNASRPETPRHTPPPASTAN